MNEYTLVRSARRTLAVEIKNLEVIVHAPNRMSKRDIDRFVAEHGTWILNHMARQRKRLESHPEPNEARKNEYIRLAKEILPQKVAHYSAVMGSAPAGMTITGAKTRFGSCSSNKRICFSWRLMQYPDAAIDYVVVHELAHLEHMDHSPAFYALIEKYMPDWKARKKLLRE